MNCTTEQEREEVANFVHSLPTGLSKEDIYVRIHERARAIERQAAAAAAGKIMAWASGDGRVQPESAMETARRVGGATALAMAPYTIALVPATAKATDELIGYASQSGLDRLRNSDDDGADLPLSFADFGGAFMVFVAATPTQAEDV